MKIIPAPVPDFDIYIARSGTAFIEREGESLEALYAGGYLPYSGTVALNGIFYSARSARVILPHFELTSENRRIAKKFDGQFQKERIPGADFKADEAFFDFCLAYFKERHGERAMPRQRLETILSCDFQYDIMKYHTEDGNPIAYVIEVHDGSMGHYWFSFYDLSLMRQSLGMWLMLDCIRDAKARGLTHYYLGTVYGHKALYKTNFEPLEWWDSNGWSGDVALLKELGRKD